MHLFSVFSLRNRALIALVTIVVAVFGGITLTLLKQELIPSLSLPQLFVISSYPGASPAVVEHDVSTPIENAIQSIPGLEETSATSSANSSSVTAQFAYSTDLSQAEEKITTAINRIRSSLPDGVDPQVIQFSLSDLPIMQLGVTSDLSAVDLSDRLQRIAIPELSRLDGVASVGLQGDRVQEIDITPDPAKLAEHGVSTQSIQSALSQNGVLLPAGSITTDGQTLNVQAGVRLSSADDIAALPLLGASPAASLGAATPDEASTEVVTIGDVATVQLVDQAPTGYSRVDGKDALTLSITKTDAGNTVSVSDAVLDDLDSIASGIGGNTQFTVVFNQAPFITQSIESLTQEGLLGLVFAVIVILIFLLSIRSTLVTAVSIPTSVLITFIGMWAFGYTLNIITLGGLTIAIGRVVDDSIVVIENIKRHIEFGEEKRQAILKAVREVAGAVTASTITTIAVFLPIGLVGEEVGELFRPFAVTVGIALIASLLVALTIVPVLAYWFLGRGSSRKRAAAPVAAAPGGEAPAHTGSIGHVEEKPSMLQRGYLPIIRWTLRYPVVVILLAVLVLGGTGAFAALGGLKINFIGDSGQNTATVTESFDPGTSLDAQNEASKKVESALLKVDGVETVQTSVGSGGGGLQAAFGSSNGATFSLTTDPDRDQAEVQEAIKSTIAGIADAGTLALSASSGFASSTVDVTVRAPDDDTLQQAVAVVEDAVKDLPSVSETDDDIAASLPYVAVDVDRAKAAAHGLSETQVGAVVMAAMNPTAAGTVSVDDRTVSIYVKDDAPPATLEELQAFAIPTPTGPVALGDLATVERTLGPTAISTDQGIRTATVSLTPATDDTGATTFAVNDAIEDLELPSGASVETGGAAKQLTDTFGQLGLALLAAILIVYVVMVATFKSLRQPLLLLVSIPFAGTGAVLLQVASGIPLGASSLIGVLMLVGIVVTNAIVLVDLVNQYRVAGMDARTAVEQGAARRLRPILMTAAATIFALIPLATGLTGHGGGFISQPLAIIVIGGLVSSTVLTLIVLPSLYYLVEGRRERRAPALAAKAERRRAARDAKLAGRARTDRVDSASEAAKRSRRARRHATAAAVGSAGVVAADGGAGGPSEPTAPATTAEALEAASVAMAAASAGAEPLPEMPETPIVPQEPQPAADAAVPRAVPEPPTPAFGAPVAPSSWSPASGAPSSPYAPADESVEATAPVVPSSAQPTNPVALVPTVPPAPVPAPPTTSPDGIPSTTEAPPSFGPLPAFPAFPAFPTPSGDQPPAVPTTTSEPGLVAPAAPEPPVAPEFPVTPIEEPPSEPQPPARPFPTEEPMNSYSDPATQSYEPIESVWSSTPDPAAPGAPQPPSVPQPPTAPEAPPVPEPVPAFPIAPVEPTIPAPAPEPTVPSEPEPGAPLEPSGPIVPPAPVEPTWPDWRTPPSSPDESRP